MIDRLAALLGFALMAAFVLYLAIDIGQLPLAVIIVVVVVLAAIDVWQSGLRGNGS